MANTLSHIRNLYWIVIEDENHKVKAVEKLLNRTALPYTYFPAKTPPGYPRKLSVYCLPLHFQQSINDSKKIVLTAKIIS